jgi:hypothetical protein
MKTEEEPSSSSSTVEWFEAKQGEFEQSVYNECVLCMHFVRIHARFQEWWSDLLEDELARNWVVENGELHRRSTVEVRTRSESEGKGARFRNMKRGSLGHKLLVELRWH